MTTLGSRKEALSGKTYNGVPAYILDGKNIGKWLGPQNGKPVVEFRILLTLVAELLRRGIKFICVFESNTPCFIVTDRDKKIYARLVASFPDVFVETIDGAKAAEGILQLANQYANSMIVSNDDYKEYRTNDRFDSEYSWLAPKKGATHSSRIVSGAAIPEVEFLIVGAFDINTRWGESADDLYAKIVTLLIIRMPEGLGMGCFGERAASSQSKVFNHSPEPISV
jgi:hypothetical protein